MSNECDESIPYHMRPISAYGGEYMYFGSFCFRGGLGFRNCDDICKFVVIKQFELLQFVFNSIYVDLNYNEIFLTFTDVCVCLCSHVVCL